MRSAVSSQLESVSCLVKQICMDGSGCEFNKLIFPELGLLSRFILEGIPAVIVGVLIWFFLPDYPETAKFLTQEERDFCNVRMGPFAPRGKPLLRFRSGF